jgi:hypothetical protein
MLSPFYSLQNNNTTQHSIIVDRIIAADYDSVLDFFPAHQDFEMIELVSVKNGLYSNI